MTNTSPSKWNYSSRKTTNTTSSPFMRSTGKPPADQKEQKNYYIVMSFDRSLQRRYPLACWCGKKDGDNGFWKIYGSAIYEEAYAYSVGWYKHEMGQVQAVVEARRRYLEGTYEHPSHYYIHVDIPPRRLSPIPVDQVIPWDTPLSSLGPVIPPLHPWEVEDEHPTGEPVVERLDDEWAPVMLEGVRSSLSQMNMNTNRDGTGGSGGDSSGSKRLDGAMKQVMSHFLSLTPDDFKKLDALLATPRFHTRVLPSLINSGVEPDTAELLSNWMLGNLSTL